MVSEVRIGRTVLARCWRRSCYGLLFVLCTVLVFVMMWLLWCYVGLIAIPTSEPQRRAIVHYASTAKPNLTTISPSSTTPKAARPPQRGSSRGEAPVLQESPSAGRTESSTSKGDFSSRDRANKPTTNSSADILNKGPATVVDAKRYDDQASMDGILVRAVSSSSQENRDDLTGAAPRDFGVEEPDKSRKPAEVAVREDRPVDRGSYDDRPREPSRPPVRDYVDPDLRGRDDRIQPSRSEERSRRTEPVRPYDDRDPPRSQRDRDDYPRRRYDDVDDREYSRPPSRREDDVGYRETVRRVDDDYDRRRRLPPRDDPYPDERPRGDAYDRRRPIASRVDDDVYSRSEDRSRSRVDGRDDRYDDYRRDRYRDEDKYVRRPVDDADYRRDDDRYKRRDDRDDDKYRTRPLDEVYRPRTELDASTKRDDLRPRGDVGTYRDEIEPRRSRDDILSSTLYEPRIRDELERREDSRKYVVETPTDLRSSIADDRSKDRKEDRRGYVASDIGYESRSRAPLDSDRDRPRVRDDPRLDNDRDRSRVRDDPPRLDYDRDRPRVRDDPRYDDRVDGRGSSRRRYSDDPDRRRIVDDIDADRYRERRKEEDLPRPVRTDDDYRSSSTRLSKGDDRGPVDRDRPVYVEDRELSRGVRTRPEDVTLDRRSYSDDDYSRNRPRIDPKLSYDKDDKDDRYRPPPRRSSDPDLRDDRYEGRYRDKYEDDRRDDSRYSRDDRTRDLIQPSRAVVDDRPIRSYADPPPRDAYSRDPRPRVDDIPPRVDPDYGRESDSRRKDYIPSLPTNIREKRFQEPDDMCADGRRSCDSRSSHGTSSSKFDKPIPERALTPKEVIEAAYRHREVSDRPVETVYPVYDPRVSNMTSPEIIRPNERRGTTITSKKRKK